MAVGIAWPSRPTGVSGAGIEVPRRADIDGDALELGSADGREREQGEKTGGVHYDGQGDEPSERESPTAQVALRGGRRSRVDCYLGVQVQETYMEPWPLPETLLVRLSARIWTV